MKIFYTASFYGKKRYQKYYDLVLEAIKKHSKDVISPELGNYLKILSDKEKMKIKDLYKIHYEAIRKGIMISDLVIIEISHPGFRLGHEATLAIQSKKPVLCLSIHGDMSEKIDSNYFFGAKYDEENVDEIVSEFIKRHSKNILNQRFNMLFSNSQLSYLEKVSESKGISVSAYIRWLVDKERGVS